jgi:hypothetical protein
MSPLPFALVLLLSVARTALGADDHFQFALPDGARFVRTTTRTARFEVAGMMRIEKTVFRARFVVREKNPGYVVTMTPLSFQYSVNGEETASPAWEMIRGHDLQLRFNLAGKVLDARGYEDIDKELEKGREFSPTEMSIHLDRFPIGTIEQDAWSEFTLLWLNQRAAPGTKLEYDSMERSFTGDRVPSHTVMEVVRAKPCGAARCVVTTYKMVPDLSIVRVHANAQRNDDFIDSSASEEVEQLVEPATMLPHYERVVWKGTTTSATPEGKLSEAATLTTVSEYAYESKPAK